MGDEIYLGYSDYDPRPHTRISCTAKAVDGAWRLMPLETELPPLGKVFAVNLGWIKPHQPVAVTAQPNPRFVEEGKDQLIVDKNWPLRQVIDFRRAGREAARFSLIEKGVVRIAPCSKELVVALSDSECAVVEMSQHPVNSRLVATPGAIKIHSLNAAVFQGDSFDDQYLEVPGQTVGELQGEINWSLDQDLLEALLKKLKQFDEGGPSRTERQQIIALLNRAHTFVDEHTDWAHLREWLNGYIPRIHEDLQAPPRIAETLAQIEPVRDALEEIRAQTQEQLRKEIEPEVRRNIDAQLADLRAKRDALEAETDEKISTFEALENEEQALRESIANLSIQLTKEVNALNHGLGAIDDQEGSEPSALVDRLRAALGAAGHLLEPIDSSLPPWSRRNQPGAIEAIGHQDVPARFQEAARRMGVTRDDFRMLDIAMRSGALAILPQHEAELMVPAYANVITGGCYFREPLGAGILGLDDLWVTPARGTSTGFGRAWATAELEADQYHLVWLDGIERTPMDLWLPSLIGVLASHCRPANLLVVASIGDSVLDPARVWQELAQTSIAILPNQEAVRTQALLGTVVGLSEKITRLAFEPTGECDELALLDYLEDLGDKRPSALKVEAGLYLTESRFTDEKATIRERLNHFMSLRNRGQQWLGDLLSDNK